MAKIAILFIGISVFFTCCRKETNPSIYGDWRLTERTILSTTGESHWEKDLQNHHYELIRFSSPDQFFLIQDVSPYTYKANFKISGGSIYINHLVNAGYENDTLRIQNMSAELLWLTDQHGIDYKYIRVKD